MKNKVLHTVAFALALLVAYIGGGVNIYHYCCNTCEEYAGNVFNTVPCCEVHEHCHKTAEYVCNHTEKEHCVHITETDKHCEIEHVQAPILLTNSLEPFDFSTPFTAVIPTFKFDEALIATESHLTFVNNTDYSDKCNGRTIIVLKSSYLI